MMANKIVSNIIRKLSLPVIGVLLVVSILLSGGCAPGNPTSTIQVSPTGINQAGGGLSYVASPLPAWTAGQFGSVQLGASGGQPPYAWRVKAGSQLPNGFTFNQNGVLSGTPPLLAGGTTEFITPPFTVIVRDNNGQEKEVELRVTIIQPKPQIFNLAVGVNPANSGGVTQSLSPDPAGYHEGDMVMLTAKAADGWTFNGWVSIGVAIVNPANTTIRFNMPGNNVNVTANFIQNVYSLTVNIDPPGSGTVARNPDQNAFRAGDVVTLTARPADGWKFKGWESFDIGAANPANAVLTFNMPESDVDVTAVFVQQPPEVFEGDFNTLFGSFGASNGCDWDEYISLEVKMTLLPGNGSVISGNVDFCAELVAIVTYTPYNVICDGFSSTMEFNGKLSGTTTNFGGDYASPGARPLQISLRAVKDGDRVICALTLTKVMQVTVNGVFDKLVTLSTTFSGIVLLKQQ
jgi:uncharacterized repeat protein (TIGR02543 family)